MSFSFDIVSEYDKAEVNNVLAAAQREIANRYDFKNTPAAIEWLDNNKSGYKLIGNSAWQIEALTDILRKHLVNRGQSSKILDLSQPIVESNLKAVQEVPFVEGLDQTKAKQVAAYIREQFPKVKPSIQGPTVRVVSGSKDELQAVMQAIRSQDFDFAVSFTNYR